MAIMCHSMLAVNKAVIYQLIFSKFYIWPSFINLSLMFEYGFCPMSNNQDGHQLPIPFSLQSIMWGPWSDSDCSSSCGLPSKQESTVIMNDYMLYIGSAVAQW